MDLDDASHFFVDLGCSQFIGEAARREADSAPLVLGNPAKATFQFLSNHRPHAGARGHVRWHTHPPRFGRETRSKALLSSTHSGIDRVDAEAFEELDYIQQGCVPVPRQRAWRRALRHVLG